MEEHHCAGAVFLAGRLGGRRSGAGRGIRRSATSKSRVRRDGAPRNHAAEGEARRHRTNRQHYRRLHDAAGRVLSHPTLCTGRDPGIPYPPAAGATPEGEGSRKSPASEVDGRSFSKIASRSTVEGERAVSRALVLSLFSGVSCEVIMKRYILG
jgi:hypothetical protein